MAPSGDRAGLVLDYVRQCVMTVLRRGASEGVGPRDRLMDLGVDSLMAVELRNLIGKGLRLSRPLPATLMFDYPTPAAIADYVAAQLAFANGHPAPTAETVEAVDGRAGAATAVADLTDAEVEALLIEKLDRM